MNQKEGEREVTKGGSGGGTHKRKALGAAHRGTLMKVRQRGAVPAMWRRDARHTGRQSGGQAGRVCEVEKGS